MKRKVFGKVAVVCAAMALCGVMAACSGKKTEGDGSESSASASASSAENGSGTNVPVRTYVKDMDLDKYISLKDYEAFRVAADEIVVSQEEWDQLVDEVYLNTFPAELGVKDRAVESGDTVNIDYEGKKDGVAFDGGTAQAQNLTIGSHSFIDGFEDGLIGVMPGETVDLNLTFPEVYHSEELAGQAVVFTVTVNYIIPEEKMDEAVKGLVEEVNSVEDLRQYVYDYLYSVAEMDQQEEYEEKILDAFVEQYCEFKELPENWIEYYKATVNNNLVTYALQSATDPETLTQTYYGKGLQEFLADYAETAVRRELAMQCVAKKEGLTLEDETVLNEALEEIAGQYGAASVDEFLSGNSMTKEDFRQDYAYELALSRIVEIAKQK